MFKIFKENINQEEKIYIISKQQNKWVAQYTGHLTKKK